MWLKSNNFAVRIGGNTFINCPVLVQYKNMPLFTLTRKDDGYLAIDFEVYAPFGQKVATVKRNNIYVSKGARDRYVFEGDADRVVLVEKETGNIIAEVRKRAAAEPEELAVTLRTYLPNGLPIEFGPDRTNLGGTQISDCTLDGCAVGMQID